MIRALSRLFFVPLSAVAVGTLFTLWGSILFKALLCVVTIVPRKIFKADIFLYLLLVLVLSAYVFFHLPTDPYHLRVLFFFCGINVSLFAIRFAVKRIHSFQLAARDTVIGLTIFILLLANLAFVNFGEVYFANNLTAEESERFRGAFPEILALAIVLSIRNRLLALLAIPCLVMIFFILTGTRSTSALLGLTALASLIFSTRQFYMYLVFQMLILYPILVMIIAALFDVQGSFLIKGNGMLTIFEEINFWGHGIQIPIDASTNRISERGFHFSAADYGFYGVLYELGLIGAFTRLIVIMLIFKRLKLAPNNRLTKVYIAAFSPFILGYGMSVDFPNSLLGLFLVHLLMRREAESATVQCKRSFSAIQLLTGRIPR